MVEEWAADPEQPLHAPPSPPVEVETPRLLVATKPDDVNPEWQRGYRQLQLIHQLTLAVVEANELETIYEEALRGLQEVVGANRAAVLLFDDQGVMQFVAWRGLSDGYRQAATGHSPWTPDALNPEPLLVSDVAGEASLATLADRITAEGINALGFIPLLYQGRLMGKFMLYYDQPHPFMTEEVQLAQTIAGHVAFAIERQRAAQALQEANERLEQRVAARTAELHQRNAALQAEIVRREKVEETLRQSEEQYRTLARNIPKAAVFLFDQDLRLKLVEGDDKIHPSFYKGAEGKTVWELMPPEEYNSRGRYYREALQGKSHVYERAVNGRTLQVYVLPIQNEQGEISAVMTMAQDITEHKEAQANLARNAEQLRTLNEVGQVIASSLDLDVVFRRVLDGLRRLLGAEGVFILLQEGDDLVVAAANEAEQGRMLGRRLPLDSSSASVEVFRTGRPLWLKGEALRSRLAATRVAQDSRYFPEVLLAAPLQLQGRPIGVMAATHGQADAFNEADFQLLEAVAVWTAIAVGNGRQHQALQRRLREREALALISQALSETLDMALVLELIAVSAQQIIPNVDWSVIHLLDEKKQLLYPAAVAGLELPAGEYLLHPGEGIGGRAIEEGKVINVADIQQDPRRATVHERLGLRALLVCPVQSHTRRLGTITIHRSSAERFSAEDEQLLGTLGSQVAMAIENARLFKVEQQARQTAEMMRAVAAALNQTLDLDVVLETLLDHLQQLIGYDRASILLVNTAGRLRRHALRPADTFEGSDKGRHLVVPIEELPPLKEIFDRKQSLIIENVANYPQWKPLPGHSPQARSWLGVPLLAGDMMIGVYVMDKETALYFNEQHVLLAEALAAQAAVAVQNARLFKQVEAGRERLRQLTQKVVSAQEEERRRISYDLHDEAGQALTAVKINLSLLAAELPDSQERLRRELVDTKDLVSEAMEQIRLLAHDLRPPIVDSFSLNVALETMCKEFGRRTSYQATYQGEELPALLADEVTISFYRFVQEALTNVMKHAGANRVEVILRREPDRIVVSVADDGRGFEVEDGNPYQARSGGVGLTGMQERFDLLGGKLEINSVPGKGTTVTAYVPYQGWERP